MKTSKTARLAFIVSISAVSGKGWLLGRGVVSNEQLDSSKDSDKRAHYLAFGEVPSLAQRTTVRWSSNNGEAMDFQLFLPRGWRLTGRKWPMLVFLHGSGDGVWDVMNSQSLPRLLSRDQSTPFDAARTWNLEFDGATYSNASFADTFGFVTIMPQGWTSVQSQGWDRARLVQLTALVAAVVQAYNADPARVSLTGQSAGGVGAWMYAIHASEIWAAVVPICGASLMNPSIAAKKLVGVPLWVIPRSQLAS